MTSIYSVLRLQKLPFAFISGCSSASLGDVLLRLRERGPRRQQVQEPIQPGTHRPPPFLVTLNIGSH